MEFTTQLWAAISNNPTRGKKNKKINFFIFLKINTFKKKKWHFFFQVMNGIVTLHDTFFQRIYTWKINFLKKKKMSIKSDDISKDYILKKKFTIFSSSIFNKKNWKKKNIKRKFFLDSSLSFSFFTRSY